MNEKDKDIIRMSIFTWLAKGEEIMCDSAPMQAIALLKMDGKALYNEALSIYVNMTIRDDVSREKLRVNLAKTAKEFEIDFLNALKKEPTK